MNLGGVPTRGGRVLEGLPSLMTAWFMDLHERLVTRLMGVCRSHRGGPSLGS